MITYTNLIKNLMYFRNVYTHVHTNQTQRVPESKHTTNFSKNGKILIAEIDVRPQRVQFHSRQSLVYLFLFLILKFFIRTIQKLWLKIFRQVLIV